MERERRKKLLLKKQKTQFFYSFLQNQYLTHKENMQSQQWLPKKPSDKNA